MTVATEFAKTSQQIEYFVTVEGVGWPTNGLSGALSGGFDGVVWCTNDINGTLATDLGCTVYHGLQLPDSISESIDPRTASYSPSGLSLKIIDRDDWWLGNMTPRKQGTTTALNIALPYGTTTLRLTDGTNFDNGDAVWIGGKECVLLSNKALIGGVVYSYTATRGYLGTQRGSSLRRHSDYVMGYWPADATVQTVPWWWWNRKIGLWAHVPGETVANCQLMWYGKVRSIKTPQSGIEWAISANGDFLDDISRVYRAVDWRVKSTKLDNGQPLEDIDLAASVADGRKRSLRFQLPAAAIGHAIDDGWFHLATAYQYRTEPGGLAGMVTAWNAGNVQAATIGAEDNILRSMVLIDDGVYYMARLDTAFSNTRPIRVLADILSVGGEGFALLLSEDNRWPGRANLSFSETQPARFLLDNRPTDKESSRFYVEGSVRRNPIDVALIFMLSMDRELYRSDTAAGSTDTVIAFAASGAPADAWIGKALFAMEAGEKYESRTITDNDATTITVDRAFSGAPAAGEEYQVRNSIYDVLPFGWGLGVPSESVDVDSFEDLRDNYLEDVSLSFFMLGAQDEIDIWETLKENIFKPYGILVYFDYTDRKIKARYMGHPAADGVFDDHVAINTEHIIKNGDLLHSFAPPIGSIKLNVRSVDNRVSGITRGEESYGSEFWGRTRGTETPTYSGAPALMEGALTTIDIKSGEANIAFCENNLDTLEIGALLNNADDFVPLAVRLQGLLGEYSVPPSVWTPELDIELYHDLEPGVFCVINWNTPDAPANPLTGTRGWNDVVGRVISRSYPLKGSPSFKSKIELFAANRIGRIAPAVTVTAKGADGLGAYFECATAVGDQNYVADPVRDKDYHFFAVGDLIEHRDSGGAIKAAWANRSITGFGTTEVSDPTAAVGSPMRIYVDGAIGSAVAANDYITFTAWADATNTARMEKYSAYASSTELLDGTDPARQYG